MGNTKWEIFFPFRISLLLFPPISVKNNRVFELWLGKSKSLLLREISRASCVFSAWITCIVENADVEYVHHRIRVVKNERGEKSFAIQTSNC